MNKTQEWLISAMQSMCAQVDVAIKNKAKELGVSVRELAQTHTLEIGPVTYEMQGDTLRLVQSVEIKPK